MPVRSSTSSVLRWPDRATVDAALRGWAGALAGTDPAVLRIGYVGSYARGDWGPGSDLDVLLVVESSPEEFTRRPATVDTTGLPVPVDLMVYTRAEWERLDPRSRFARMVAREAVWVFARAAAPG
jgi:predicted nucleotidyltransferase